jgi:putative colanic acid biosynthesis acetyltransferase WcaF
MSPGAAPPRDPYLYPRNSLGNRTGRALWHLIDLLLFRWTPRPLHAWRALLLRAFGARLGRRCHIYAKAEIWAPWNLICEDGASIADGAVIYNVAPVTLGSHAIVSQQAYVCTASPDYEDPTFPMTSEPITIGAYAWVGARACVLPGVRLHEGAVLGLGSVATEDLEAWQVYAGSPARAVRARKRFLDSGQDGA